MKKIDSIKEHKLVKKLIDNLRKNVNVINESNYLELDNICYMHTPDIKHDVYYLDGAVRTCIQFKRLPEQIGKGILDCFKGSPFFMITIDEGHLSNDVATSFMDKKVDELENDSSDASKNNEKKHARHEITTQARFSDRIFKTGDNCKYVTIRLYLKHRTLKDLESLIRWTNDCMKRYDLCGCVQRNLLENDLKALSSFSNTTKTIVTTKALSNMIMSDDITEIQPFAFPLGSTNSGAYCPDYFSYRYRSFCTAIIGMQGSGKSALIKKIIKHALMRGEQVIILDMHNKEYKEIGELFNLPTITLSIKDAINIYQIFRNDELNGESISELTISEAISLAVSLFLKHSKLKENDDVVTFYSNILTEMYQTYKNKKIEEFKDEDWFITEDILNFILENENKYKYDGTPQQVIFSLKQKLIGMITKDGFFYNRKTNIHLDLTKSFRFDLSFLEVFETEGMKNAYIALMCSYLGKAVRRNEIVNEAIEKGKQPIRPTQPLTIAFEETGTLFKDIEVKRRIDILMRQTRKARTMLLFAFHTINDINGGTKEDADLTKSIFGLCAHIIMGEIDENTAIELPKYAKNITRNDTRTAQNFIIKDEDREKRRSFLACTADGKKIKFKTKLLPSEGIMFGGGK